MKDHVYFKSDARLKLKSGLDKLANAVKITLGPKGSTVIINNSKFETPIITKDGVTVAKEFELLDPIENAAVKILKEVAIKTLSTAGDGTTTATVLAQAIISEGMIHLDNGANTIDIKRGIDIAIDLVSKQIAFDAMQVSNDMGKIREISYVSSNNDKEISDIITEVYTEVSTSGIVHLEDSYNNTTYFDVKMGMQVNSGYTSPYFVNDTDKANCVFKECHLLLVDGKISDTSTILPILTKVSSAGTPLLIISNGLEGPALKTIVANVLKNGLKVVAINTKGFGNDKINILDDIAVLTGGTIISESNGDKLIETTVDQLGHCATVSVDAESTTIINPGKEDIIEARVTELRKLEKDAITKYDKDLIKERIARFTGGIATLYVGAITDVERQEKKDRVDDALCATRAAIEEGIVVGGGLYLHSCQSILCDIICDNDDQALGIECVRKALNSPLATIVQNAGLIPEDIFKEIKDHNNDYIGYNARTNTFENLMEAGIVDPAKVTRTAIENAGSIAGMLLSTGCVINIEEQ
jgi:chaperonin GroEL